MTPETQIITYCDGTYATFKNEKQLLTSSSELYGFAPDAFPTIAHLLDFVNEQDEATHIEALQIVDTDTLKMLRDHLYFDTDTNFVDVLLMSDYQVCQHMATNPDCLPDDVFICQVDIDNINTTPGLVITLDEEDTLYIQADLSVA